MLVGHEVHQPAGSAAAHAQPLEHAGPPEVGVDEQDVRAHGLGQTACEVDRGEGLAVLRSRARHGHHAQPLVALLLDEMTQHAVLVGGESLGMEEGDQLGVCLGREEDLAAFEGLPRHGRGRDLT